MSDGITGKQIIASRFQLEVFDPIDSWEIIGLKGIAHRIINDYLEREVLYKATWICVIVYFQDNVL